MNQSDSIKELAGALAKAQAQLRPAIKDSENPHFRSKYAGLAAIWDACREALTGNGLSVVQMPLDSGDGRVALTTTLLHASGEYISSTCSTRLQQDSAQGVGSALTYLRRYALAAMVGVVADDDDDGNAASQAPQAQRTAQQPRQAARQAPRPPTQTEATNGKPSARAALEARLQATIAEAHALGLDVADADKLAGKSDVELIAAGKRLRAAIEKAQQEAEWNEIDTAAKPGRMEEADLPL